MTQVEALNPARALFNQIARAVAAKHYVEQ